MTRCERKSVVLRDGVLWNRPFSASKVALLIMHLFNHDFRVNDQQVYPLLDIDMKTRRQQDNVPKLESERTREYRIINKALAGELLSGLLLTHLNSASEIRAWCETRHGQPHKFAGPGVCGSGRPLPGHAQQARIPSDHRSLCQTRRYG